MILNDIEKVRKLLEIKTNEELLPYIKEIRGYYFKVKKNNEIESLIVLDEKDSNENLELYNEFKLMKFYNETIDLDANKAISYNLRKLISVTPQSLIFKFDVKKDKMRIEKDKFIIGSKDIRKNEKFISDMNEVLGIKKEEIIENMDKLILAINKIKGEQPEIFKNDQKLYFFLDKPIDEFKDCYYKYLNSKIFSKTHTYKFNNIIYGTICNMSDKKKTIVDNRRSLPYAMPLEDAIASELSRKLKLEKIHEREAKKKIYVYTEISNLKIGKPQIMTRLEFKNRVEMVNALFKDKKALNSEKGQHKRKNQYNMLKGWFNNYIKDVDIDIADNLLEFLVNLIMDNIVYEKKKIKNEEVWEYNKETSWDLDKILSIKDYVEQKGGEFKMLKIIENIKNDIREGKDIKIENDIQAAYLFGQTSQYLVYHSEAKDKRGGAFEGVRIENFDSIKEKIYEQYSKYSYKLSYSPDNILNKLVCALMEYESEAGNKLLPKQIKTDRKLAYLSGAISSNIISEVNKENKNSKNNKEMKGEVR